MPSRLSPPEVVAWLSKHKAEGALLTANASARPRIVRGRIPFSTNAVEYPAAMSVVCYQAVMIFATGLSLEALGK